MICAFALGVTGSISAAQDWSFDVTPYLWVADVSLQTSVPVQPSPTSSEVNEYASRLSAVAMLAAKVQYRSVGLLLDFAWVRVNTEAVEPAPQFASVNLESDFIHSTAALTYRLPWQGRLQTEAFAGARLWYVGNRFEAASGTLTGFNASEYKTWIDPILGADLRYELSQRWSGGVKGDVGGFGASAELAWEVLGDITYRLSDWCSLSAGYRFLYEDYDRGNYTFDATIRGFIVGFGMHF